MRVELRGSDLLRHRRGIAGAGELKRPLGARENRCGTAPREYTVVGLAVIVPQHEAAVPFWQRDIDPGEHVDEGVADVDGPRGARLDAVLAQTVRETRDVGLGHGYRDLVRRTLPDVGTLGRRSQALKLGREKEMCAVPSDRPA